MRTGEKVGPAHLAFRHRQGVGCLGRLRKTARGLALGRGLNFSLADAARGKIAAR
jgi:hypothetical protein